MGVFPYRRIVARRRADLFGGVGSFPGEGVIFTALEFLLEEELEVFLSFSHGLVLLGGDPEVELLCIPVQRSQRLVRCNRVPFGGRLSGIESMEEAEREEEEEGEEEEEEESPKELEPEEEEMAMAGEGLGFCATGFGRKKEFAVKKS